MAAILKGAISVFSFFGGVLGMSTADQDLVAWGGIFAMLGADFIRWSLVALSVLIIIAANWQFLRSHFRGWLPRWTIKVEFHDRVPMRRLISMSSAAALLRDGIAGSEAADMWSKLLKPKSDPQILEFYAELMSGKNYITLYADTPWGLRQAPIGRELLPSLHFSDGGNTLQDRYSKEVKFNKISVMKSDVRKTIKYFRNLSSSG